VFFGIKSIIGSGCVLNVDQFFKEIGELESGGIKTNGLIFVAENAHIITKDHLEEDGKDTKIGTTKRGNGPAYRDKYDRRGLRAKDIPELEPYIVDLYDELYVNTPNSKVLFEGAQGFGLDIDWGDYPYVTSSNCISAAACMNGIPPQNIRHVWGVAKGYETYVGAKSFQPEGSVYSLIQEVGEEYGATTGRKRQVNWMDLNFLRKAIHINGVTHLVVNKMDVLEKVRSWALYKDGNKINFNSSNEFKDLLSKSLGVDSLHQIHFSSHKDKI